MATNPTSPIPESTSTARKRGAPYGPGLTPGVLIVAALAFFLMMGSGSMVLVQTLKATQSELQQWPVARRHLVPLEGGAGSGAAIGSDPTGAIAGDRPATSQTPAGPMTIYADPWLKYFPEVEAAMGKSPDMTPQQFKKFLYTSPRTGSWAWALLDPSSPFSRTYPDSPHLARMRARVEADQKAMKLGWPDDLETGKFTAEEEKQAQATFDAWEKKRRELQGNARSSSATSGR